MNNGRFSPALSPAEEERYKNLIEELTKIMHIQPRGAAASAGAAADARATIADANSNLELVSRQRAMISRAKMPNLSVEDRFLLRFYGRFGLFVNKWSRETGYNRALRSNDIDIARQYLDRLKSMYQLNTPEDIASIPRDPHAPEVAVVGAANNLRVRKEEMVNSFRTAIDKIIENNSHRFGKSGSLYRISRAKKNVFITPQEATERGEPVDRIVNPGDVISDRGFWSTSMNADVAIYRYGERHASNPRPMAGDEEEVLFVIENNDNLQTIDISGFKCTQEKEGLTAGEMLIKSRTKFRVIGIQNTDPVMQRRVVILRPESEANITSQDNVVNPYTGRGL